MRFVNQWRQSLSAHVLPGFLVAGLLLGGGLAGGNEIYSLSVAQPQWREHTGDQLDVTVLLFAEPQEAQLELIGYVVTGPERETQVRIRATGTENSDGERQFRLIVPLRKNGESIDPTDPAEQRAITRFDRRVTLPYAHQALPDGTHQIGYVARLFIDGELFAARPTPLMEVTVRGDSRWIVSFPDAISDSHEDRTGLAWRVNLTSRIEMLMGYDPFRTFASVDVSYDRDRDSVVDLAANYHLAGKMLRSRPTNTVPSETYIAEPRRRIHFATNRTRNNTGTKFDERFNNVSALSVDKMIYGSCVVSIPISIERKPGMINAPVYKWWRLYWQEEWDPNKHFMVEKIRSPISASEFKESLADDDLLVYIHGYNNSFRDAILRSAQLQHDLQFGGKVIAFSWPSAGSTLAGFDKPYDGTIRKVKLAYKHDEKQASRSDAFLAELLGQLLDDRSPERPRKIHLLAHSMGNRILLKALHRLETQNRLGDDSAAFGHIIMAAADADATTFSNARTALEKSCENITFYFAPNDGALAVSRVIHGDSRIGLRAHYIKDKMDTISAGNLTSVFNKLAHLYVSESPSVLTDIRLLLTGNFSPLDRRPPLGPRIEDRDFLNRFYFTFVPE